jgi:PPOX class probable F420-dependent enzyme
MTKLTAGQASFLHDEPNVGVVAALRPDGTPHQTVVWVDYDGEHVLLNLTTGRTKAHYLERDPRVSVLTLDRNDVFRWLRVEGTVVEATTEGAWDHIVRQAGVYLGKEEYPRRPGEQRLLVRIRPERVEAYKVE